MKKIALRIFAIIFAATFAAMLLPASLCAKNIPSCEEILGIAKGIIEYEKSANGSRDFLLDDKLIAEAGTLTATDWYAFAMARLGLDFDRIAYIATAEENVAARYRESGALDPSRATEWHRISLCLLACGGDPAAIVTEKGNINLISDGVYNRGNTAPLGKQGINGLIWGLLALDSIGYDVPEGSHDTRESIISGILSEELPDGGFCFFGDEADADITAMALTALAPYYNDETRYNVTVSGEVRSVAVHEAVDRAVALLSEMQCETGDFMSFGAFGERNCESTCQVAIALCALGINPFSDPRFVKNGNSVWDGIIRYRGDDGGFIHSTASQASVNRVVSYQALCAMAALYRFSSGMRPLFDLRDMQPAKVSFEESDAAYVDALPDMLTGEYYTRVVTLLYKVKCTGNTAYAEKLTSAKAEIDGIRRKIKSLNEDIDAMPAPDKLSLSDRGSVLAAAKAYGSLSEYDKTLVVGAESLAAAKAKIDTLFRTLVLAVSLSAAAVVLVLFIVLRIRHRMTRRRREMDELAAMYENEDTE